MVAVQGRSRLYVIDACTRLATRMFINPTMLTDHHTLIAAPGYDAHNFPYVFLKNTRFVSLINIKEGKILPLIRSPNDCDLNRTHYLDVIGQVATIDA